MTALRKKESIILGIAPGTWHIGYSILKNQHIIEWCVKAFPGKWSSLKLGAILKCLERIIREYQVTAISMKITEHKGSEIFEGLCREIYKLAKRYSIPIRAYHPESLNKSKYQSNYCIVTHQQKLNEAIACTLIS